VVHYYDSRMEIHLNLVKISVILNPYKNPQCRHCRHTDGALQDASKTDRQDGHILLISWCMMSCFVPVTNYQLDQTGELSASDTFEISSEYYLKPKAYTI